MSSFIIPIGPQHPALKEPEHFTFFVDGEYVTDVKVRIGYMHRGIEKAMEDRTYNQGIYLASRICGICTEAHTTCFVQNVEYAMDLKPPRRAEFIRVILCELNRLQSHMLWIGAGGHEIGFDTLFMYLWRDRERVLDILELITGNRITYAMMAVGGVRRDITSDMIAKIQKAMDIVEERAKYYKKVVLSEQSIMARTIGIGTLTPREALELCSVGPILRASGIKSDVRADDPYAAYDETPFNVITYDGCDVYSRFLVRVDEMFESINIIRYCLDHMPQDPIRIKLVKVAPEGEAVSRVEAPRGELIHYLMGKGDVKPYRYKIRAPTLGILPSLVRMLTSRENYVVKIGDIPAIVGGIDPCFCCTDRAVKFIDVSKGKTWSCSYDELNKYANRRYRKVG
jgi:NADH-quinone oxidoreductase subunit D